VTDRVRLAWLAGYAAATFLAFPHPVGAVVVDLGAWVAWLAPACLVLGLRGLAPRRAAAAGFAASWLAHSAILHWIWIVTVVYGHAHPVAGLVGPLGLGAYVAAFTAGFAAMAAIWDRRGLAGPLALAALWTALDHLRSFALSGFPWATLGYTQHGNPALLGLAPFTGVYGLSFATALAGISAARAAADWRGGARISRPAWTGALAAASLAVAGGAAALGTPPDRADTVRVAVLQGNVDQGVKWSSEWYARTLERYVQLTREAAAAGAQVVVWPETAVPGAIGGDPRHAEALERLARDTGAALVVGAVGLESGPDGRVRVFDSAFAVQPHGAVTDRYDKSHLVPFGEYVPFQEWLGRVFEAVARGIAEIGVSPGPGPRALWLDLAAGGRLPAGVPICYELLFPDIVRRFVSGGAEMLFAITNDAWYGRTGAPYQFLAITALRSAETRVWTARAANTGVSAIIDARGRVRQRTPIFESGWLVADVPRRPAPTGGSFYTRHGDVFAFSCWLAVAATCGVAWRRRRDT
jgi:apolipoprotein N-acyltransferase